MWIFRQIAWIRIPRGTTDKVTGLEAMAELWACWKLRRSEHEGVFVACLRANETAEAEAGQLWKLVLVGLRGNQV